MRLAAKLPFGQAAAELAFFWGAPLSEATIRRHAEAAGAAYVAIQTAEVERLEQGAPPTAPSEPGPAVQLVSADGAMVPLVGGAWAEVKTVTVGTVAPTISPDGTPEARATELSYFSRLADAARFTRDATVELQRRGTDTAGVVVGVMDGAPWLQGFLDHHRPDAARVLDFPHAVQHLATAAQATFGADAPEAAAWLAEQAHTLKHAAPAPVLAALRALPVGSARDPDAAAAARDDTLAYLESRPDQLRYATFRAAGYPIGSGSVESANKLVVEARLKGSGMHWAPHHVNPMLALRTVTCNDRWDEAWPQSTAQLRARARLHRLARHRARHPRAAPAVAAPIPPSPPLQPPPPTASSRRKAIVDGRPTPAHPWTRRGLFQRTPHAAKI